jgi:hypothetical protein
VSREVHRPADRAEDEDGLLTRIIGEGESPAWWGFPVANIGGCEVRIHLVTPVYILAAVAHAIWNDLGLPFVLLGLAALALVVSLHEAVRAHALVRWSKLHPIDLTLWPAGAIWRFHDEETARAEGRAALVALAAVAGCAALFAGLVVGFAPHGPQLLREFPWPSLALGSLQGGSTLHTLALVAAWQAYAMSVYLLLANAVPMLPLDCALALRARGAPRRGPDPVAAWGLGVGALLVVVGMVTGYTPVALLGVCGAVVSWFAWQSSRFAVDPAGVDRWRAALREPEHASETAEGEHRITPDDREQVERVLAKISAEGINSLTRSERRLLHEATERLRGG